MAARVVEYPMRSVGARRGGRSCCAAAEHLPAGEDKPVITGRGVGADVQGEVGDDDLGNGYQPMTGR